MSDYKFQQQSTHTMREDTAQNNDRWAQLDNHTLKQQDRCQFHCKRNRKIAVIKFSVHVKE